MEEKVTLKDVEEAYIKFTTYKDPEVREAARLDFIAKYEALDAKLTKEIEECEEMERKLKAFLASAK